MEGSSTLEHITRNGLIDHGPRAAPTLMMHQSPTASEVEDVADVSAICLAARARAGAGGVGEEGLAHARKKLQQTPMSPQSRCRSR